MAHSHSHDHSDWGDMTAGPVRAVLVTATALVGLATLIGLALLWPRGASMVDDEAGEAIGFTDRARATVLDAADEPCSYEPSETCHRTTFEITSGEAEGMTATIEHLASEDTPTGSLAEGDGILVNDAGAGVDPDTRFSFADIERSQSIWLVAAVFVLAVLLLGRLRGLLALGGLVVSLGVILLFIFPAFLHGSQPVGVALTGAALIAFATLYLAHGFSTRTTVALLGTFASLSLIAGMATGFAEMARLSGLADGEALDLLTFAPGLDFRGLLLAAIIIGALGVLDDVTVTQTSAVWELKRAAPGSSARELYSAGIRIGRDHIAATVNTLVLAYTAAAMPMLLLISQSGLSMGEVLTSETIAVEIIQTLVGSTGLIAAVPITTGLAAWVATRSQPDEDPGAHQPDPTAAPAASVAAAPLTTPDGVTPPVPSTPSAAPLPARQPAPPVPPVPPVPPAQPVPPRPNPDVPTPALGPQRPQRPQPARSARRRPGAPPHRPTGPEDFWSR